MTHITVVVKTSKTLEHLNIKCLFFRSHHTQQQEAAAAVVVVDAKMYGVCQRTLLSGASCAARVGVVQISQHVPTLFGETLAKNKMILARQHFASYGMAVIQTGMYLYD